MNQELDLICRSSFSREIILRSIPNKLCLSESYAHLVEALSNATKNRKAFGVSGDSGATKGERPDHDAVVQSVIPALWSSQLYGSNPLLMQEESGAISMVTSGGASLHIPRGRLKNWRAAPNGSLPLQSVRPPRNRNSMRKALRTGFSKGRDRGVAICRIFARKSLFGVQALLVAASTWLPHALVGDF